MTIATRAQRRTETAIEFLTGLVAIPSVSGGESPAADFLIDAMAELGYDASVDGAGNAVGTRGSGEREIMLLGHIDTVPGDIPVRIVDGVLHGRGAVDAKGPLAAFVTAGARANLPDGVRLTVIGAVGEETFGSPGASWLRDTRRAPDLLVIGEPSGWDGIVLGYKGSLALTAIIERGMTHSAGPDATAGELAFRLWGRLNAWLAEVNDDAPAGFETLDATLRSLNTTSNGLYERAIMEITFRLPPGITLDRVRAEVTSLWPEADLLWQPNAVAHRTDKRSPLVAPFLAAIRAEGGTPRLKVKTGTSDMNIVAPAWGCPAIAYGPGDARYDHTPDEQLDLAEFERGVAVLTRAIEGLGAGGWGLGAEFGGSSMTAIAPTHHPSPRPPARGSRLGLLVSHLREEEKLILAAARELGIVTRVIQDRTLALELAHPVDLGVDVVLDRCVAHTRGSYGLRIFEAWGIRTVNPSAAVAICDDKALMSLAFARAGVPSPRTAVAFTVESALEIGEAFGYPLVVKPVAGSWGRLLARANSPAALRTILEQKRALGGPQHSVFYLQEHVEKPGRDIRAFYVGGEVIAASYRAAEHWITNVARGATSEPCPITPEIIVLCRQAARAVGAEIAGVDLVESAAGLQCIEINGGAEFKGLLSTTDVPIARRIVEWVMTPSPGPPPRGYSARGERGDGN